MFKCDEMIYIQLQKTASNHIVKLLQHLFDGQTVGKHDFATAEQIDHTPYIVSSIRNPWDWYLSLWSFGVKNRGAIRRRATQRHWKDWLADIRHNPSNFYHSSINFCRKDVKQWKEVYHSTDNVAAFRGWLQLVHDPNNAHILGEGYGNNDNGISQRIGFMTYRYLRLCSRLDEWKGQTDFTATDIRSLKDLDKNHCYIHFFIRQENLVKTFIQGIEKIRPLSEMEKSLVQRAEKSNVSARQFPLAEYYDQPSIDLVMKRDQLLIEKFNYSFDSSSAQEIKQHES